MMRGRRYGGMAGKERRVHRLNRVAHRAASDAIADYYVPDDRPGLRKSFVPVRRGERLLASFHGSHKEALPTEQLELPFPSKVNPLPRPGYVSQSFDPLDTGWTLVSPAEGNPTACQAAPPSTESKPCPVSDRRATADSDATRGQKSVAVIRAPRTVRTADAPAGDATFSIRRFLMGCAAGLATAAMIIITIRLAIG